MKTASTLITYIYPVTSLAVSNCDWDCSYCRYVMLYADETKQTVKHLFADNRDCLDLDAGLLCAVCSSLESTIHNKIQNLVYVCTVLVLRHTLSVSDSESYFS
jgi:hypothetical protein